MNKNLLIALPILAILSLGAVALLNHKQSSFLKANPIDTITFDTLRACQSKVAYHQCNEIDDDKAFDLCQQAAYDFGHLTQAGNILLSCDKYNTLFNTAIAQDLVNQGNNYYTCYTDLKVLNAVRKSDFYYRNIFAPKYLDCAQIKL